MTFGFGTRFWPSAPGYLANISPSLPHPPPGGCGLEKGAFCVRRITDRPPGRLSASGQLSHQLVPCITHASPLRLQPGGDRPVHHHGRAHCVRPVLDRPCGNALPFPVTILAVLAGAGSYAGPDIGPGKGGRRRIGRKGSEPKGSAWRWSTAPKGARAQAHQPG